MLHASIYAFGGYNEPEGDDEEDGVQCTVFRYDTAGNAPMTPGQTWTRPKASDELLLY